MAPRKAKIVKGKKKTPRVKVNRRVSNLIFSCKMKVQYQSRDKKDWLLFPVVTGHAKERSICKFHANIMYVIVTFAYKKDL